jgi:hypothetical protein
LLAPHHNIIFYRQRPRSTARNNEYGVPKTGGPGKREMLLRNSGGLKGTASRHHQMFIKVEGDITSFVFLLNKVGEVGFNPFSPESYFS